MRIALLSLSYPPHSYEGIPRQRQILAQAFAQLGHTVHVITCTNTHSLTRTDRGVIVHEIALAPIVSYDNDNPSLNVVLSSSQRLLQGLLEYGPFDIVDVPLWSAQGFATLMRTPGPSVVWLQTTTKQLLEIHGEQMLGLSEQLIELERHCLERADGWLSDSDSVLDAVQHDYLPQAAALIGKAHIGIPDYSAIQQTKRHSAVNLLVVGRLEQRKGTPFVFSVLPSLLRKYPQLQLTFVGRDNSDNDGWKRRYGASYSDVFRKRFPDLDQQVHFEGYVDEARLERFYQKADVLLVPSLYESFGIVYLEAMRAAVPVLTFAAGGASEIFPKGEQDGAIVVAPGDTQAFSRALVRLIREPETRLGIGAAGRTRFQATFTDMHMAQASLDFYEHVIAQYRKNRIETPTVFQYVTALYPGDAVSTIVQANAALLGTLGQATPILTSEAPEGMQHTTATPERIFSYASCGLIFHYSGFNSATWMLQSIGSSKALYYHNITPPEFFSRTSDMFEHLRHGYTQLRLILKYFDLLIGDSRYNISTLEPWLHKPVPSLHLYPIIEREELQAAPYNQDLRKQLTAQKGTKLLFVGRLAPNKRPDKLIRLIDFYRKQIDPQAQLWLVGNHMFDRSYQMQIEQLRDSLGSDNHIHMTGKVSDADLYAYYRAADIFVCASEHEGFCVPIAQAMAFDLPVIAYAATAVPETMGGTGILLNSWDEAHIAEQIVGLQTQPAYTEKIRAAQHQALLRFSRAEARKRLRAILQYLLYREPSELFEYF